MYPTCVEELLPAFDRLLVMYPANTTPETSSSPLTPRTKNAAPNQTRTIHLGILYPNIMTDDESEAAEEGDDDAPSPESAAPWMTPLTILTILSPMAVYRCVISEHT